MKNTCISFCTVCMNRLHHIKETLPRNISDNASFENTEFVLLDYNSTDNLEGWVRSEMMQHLATGKLKYFRTFEPTVFHRSHSHNMSFKLAEGSILCNLDADNYTGENFARFISESFHAEPGIFLTPIDFQLVYRYHNPIAVDLHGFQRHYNPIPDVLGRVCFSKESFLAVKGFSEIMSAHGFQDYDFANRLELAGFKRKLINNPSFLAAITHDDQERFSNEAVKKNLYKILYRPISVFESHVVFLYNTQKFDMGIIVNNIAKKSSDPRMAFQENNHRYDFVLEENEWVTGTWNENDDMLIFSSDSNYLAPIKLNNHSEFSEVVNPALIKQLIIFNTQLTNRYIMNLNWDEKRIITNEGDFGRGTVFKNFNYDLPVLL